MRWASVVVAFVVILWDAVNSRVKLARMEAATKRWGNGHGFFTDDPPLNCRCTSVPVPRRPEELDDDDRQ